jgi:hypothetical protein
MTLHAGRAVLTALVLALLLISLTLPLVAYVFADRLIFLPPASSYGRGALPIGHVPADDRARIAALHLPTPTARLTLLYSHGNSEDIGQLMRKLERFRDSAGVSVLAYD